MNALDKTIIALDFPDRESTEKFVKRLSTCKQRPHYLKVGMELFYSEGPRIIELIKDLGFKVFLDLKVFDIPNTAVGAIKSIAKLGVDMTNVHALGSFAMMQRANEALKEHSPESLLIAVTILTSIDQEILNQDLMIQQDLQETVLKLAINAKEAGLDGIVSSAFEAQSIKDKCGQDFLTVCPGIRFKDNSNDDQKRVMSPDEALTSGVDYLVMGRAITQAADLTKLFERF